MREREKAAATTLLTPRLNLTMLTTQICIPSNQLYILLLCLLGTSVKAIPRHFPVRRYFTITILNDYYVSKVYFFI